MSTAARNTNKSDPPVANPTATGSAASEADAESITQTVGEPAPMVKARILTKDVAQAISDPVDASKSPADPVDASKSPADAVGESSAARPEEPGWELHPSELSADAQDALAGCLVALTKIFGSPRSAESMTTGLPLEDNRLTPPLFLRAAEHAGLSARIVRRKLGKIPDVVLPVVLLLKDRFRAG